MKREKGYQKGKDICAQAKKREKIARVKCPFLEGGVSRMSGSKVLAGPLAAVG